MRQSSNRRVRAEREREDAFTLFGNQMAAMFGRRKKKGSGGGGEDGRINEEEEGGVWWWWRSAQTAAGVRMRSWRQCHPQEGGSSAALKAHETK